MREEALEVAFCEYLAAEGWSYERQFPLGSKRVDVVAWRNDEVRSFELKISDWRAAAEQAYLNRPYFHRSYVVLPDARLRSLADDWFPDLGVGLVVLRDDGSVLIQYEPDASDTTPAVRVTASRGEHFPW